LREDRFWVWAQLGVGFGLKRDPELIFLGMGNPIKEERPKLEAKWSQLERKQIPPFFK
jgi:hypothetical protein